MPDSSFREKILPQIIGFLFGVAVSVLVAVAGELADIESLADISLAGLAITAIRSAATAVLTLLGTHIPGVSQTAGSSS